MDLDGYNLVLFLTMMIECVAISTFISPIQDTFIYCDGWFSKFKYNNVILLHAIYGFNFFWWWWWWWWWGGGANFILNKNCHYVAKIQGPPPRPVEKKKDTNKVMHKSSAACPLP